MGYVGFRLGIGAELIKLVGLTAGFFLSFRFYQGLGDALAERSFLSPEWALVLVMVALAAGGYFLVTRALRLLERLVKVSFQERFNQVGGLIVGMGRGLLVASLFLVACQQLASSRMQESIQQNSWSGRWVSRAAPAVYDTLRLLPRRVLARVEEQR